MKYLIDTDKLIDFFRGEEKTVQTMRALVEDGISLSVITVAEYFYGAAMGPRPKKEHALFAQLIHNTAIPILSVDNLVALRYAALQAELAKKGKRGNVFDILIAATALEHQLVLYTGNRKDFGHIPDLSLV